MSHGVPEASNRILGLLKRWSSDQKCPSTGQPLTDSRLYLDVVADEDLEEGDVRKMLAKEKDLLYVAADRLESNENFR